LFSHWDAVLPQRPLRAASEGQRHRICRGESALRAQ
jgi:hypothetical protein